MLDTDLLTPLGAYLRLRERGCASFLLASVEHGRGGAAILHGDAGEVARALEDDAPKPSRGRLAGAPTHRFPSQAEYEAGVATCKEYIRQGDAFQIVLSQRAERPTDASAVAL